MHPMLAKDSELLLLSFGHAFLERHHMFGTGVSAAGAASIGSVFLG